MNTKVVYAAGIAILMIGIIFYIINSGFFSSENPSISSLNNSKTTPNTVKPTTYLSSSLIPIKFEYCGSGQSTRHTK